jgi:hypothetical protein
MFRALGQSLDGDHLDLSFARSQGWPKVGPGEGMPPSLWLSVGDPVSGPAVQLGVCAPVPQTLWLDTHYHGSDQFRATLQGDFQLQRKRMVARDFGFQMSGLPYREGLVGGGNDLWMFAVQGDRRGARATLTRNDGTFVLGEIGEDQLDRPVASPDDPYWRDLPGGSRGVAALATRPAVIRGGFAWGRFGDTQDWLSLADGVVASAGVLGHGVTGPVVLAIQCDAGQVAVPAGCAATELVIAVVRGRCEIGGQHYTVGDVRVQKAHAPLAGVVAGPEGLDCVLLIADRRGIPRMPGGAPGSRSWFSGVASIVDELVAGTKGQ